MHLQPPTSAKVIRVGRLNAIPVTPVSIECMFALQRH